MSINFNNSAPVKVTKKIRLDRTSQHLVKYILGMQFNWYGNCSIKILINQKNIKQFPLFFGIAIKFFDGQKVYIDIQISLYLPVNTT